MSLYEDIKSGKEKIEAYKSGKDATKEVGDEEIARSTVEFTSDPADLKSAKFHIVAVPTPINQDKTEVSKAGYVYWRL